MIKSTEVIDTLSTERLDYSSHELVEQITTIVLFKILKNE